MMEISFTRLIQMTKRLPPVNATSVEIVYLNQKSNQDEDPLLDLAPGTYDPPR